MVDKAIASFVAKVSKPRGFKRMLSFGWLTILLEGSKINSVMRAHLTFKRLRSSRRLWVTGSPTLRSILIGTSKRGKTSFAATHWIWGIT